MEQATGWYISQTQALPKAPTRSGATMISCFLERILSFSIPLSKQLSQDSSLKAVKALLRKVRSFCGSLGGAQTHQAFGYVSKAYFRVSRNVYQLGKVWTSSRTTLRAYCETQLRTSTLKTFPTATLPLLQAGK